MSDNDSVTVEREGRIGYLTLDKPRALNALDLPMVRLLHQGLTRHEDDDHVEAIVIRSASERAFCAGGDMKHIREQVRSGQMDIVRAYFTEEYAFNLAISRCPKPYIALIDGIAMGGGLGISVHGRYRIVTDRAHLAMPEARIGLFPDVGGTCFMPRLPQRVGWWMAMASTSVRGIEAVLCGLGTHHVSDDWLAPLCTTLEDADAGPIEAIIERLAVSRELACSDAASAPVQTFLQAMAAREHWFAGDTADSARRRLAAAVSNNTRDARDTRDSRESDDGEALELARDAAELLGQLDSASPYAIQLIESLFVKNAGKDLAACLEVETEAMLEAIRHPDFTEGIRALLVDKDHRPKWAGA